MTEKSKLTAIKEGAGNLWNKAKGYVASWFDRADEDRVKIKVQVRGTTLKVDAQFKEGELTPESYVSIMQLIAEIGDISQGVDFEFPADFLENIEDKKEDTTEDTEESTEDTDKPEEVTEPVE